MNAGSPVVRWSIAAFVSGGLCGALAVWGFLQRDLDSGDASPGPDLAGHGRGALPQGRGASRSFAPSGDAAGDLRRIQRILDPANRAQAFRSLMDAMSPAELAQLMKALNRYGIDQEQEDEAGGATALAASRQMAIEHAAMSDPAAVLGALSASGAGGDGDFYQNVLRLWAARDPMAARAFFEGSTLKDPNADVKSIAGALVREMVKTDPEGTMQWLRGLKAGFTEDVARDALQTLSHYDGVLAGKLLSRHGDLKNAPEFVAAMTAGWARTEPDKAFAWARDLPAHLAPEGLKTSAAIWAGKDFPAALAAVGALQGEARAAALSGIAKSAAASHREALLPMVESLPDSPSRASAVGSLVNAWVDESPEKASAWLSRQPEGPSRDEGAIVLAIKTFEADPSSALDWASAIQGGDSRRKGVDGLVDAWLRKDPKAARQWVATSPRLSEGERARLIEKTGR